MVFYTILCLCMLGIFFKWKFFKNSDASNEIFFFLAAVSKKLLVPKSKILAGDEVNPFGFGMR